LNDILYQALKDFASEEFYKAIKKSKKWNKVLCM
jgi:hypothetical protein